MLVDKEERARKTVPSKPAWVSDRNLSFRVWGALEVLEEERANFIDGINSRDTARSKKRTTIRKKQIADYAGCSPSSLHNRNFSTGFQQSLDTANSRLEERLEERLKSLANIGMKDRRKSEILAELRSTSSELERIKKRQVSELVDKAFEQLPLRARRTLMLE